MQICNTIERDAQARCRRDAFGVITLLRAFSRMSDAIFFGSYFTRAHGARFRRDCSGTETQQPRERYPDRQLFNQASSESAIHRGAMGGGGSTVLKFRRELRDATRLPPVWYISTLD